MTTTIDTPAADRPAVSLIGADGNAFSILGLCSRAMKKAGWDKERREAVMAEMMDGDYDHLLATALFHFDVS